jgi:hypothetical protein
MNEETERRIARNEALMRDVNEAIEAGRWPGDESKALHVRCECASLDCNELIEIGWSDYESVREDPRRFAVRPGHELPEVETIVRSEAEFVVVEKRSDAGHEAEQLHPRS